MKNVRPPQGGGVDSHCIVRHVYASKPPSTPYSSVSYRHRYMPVSTMGEKSFHCNLMGR